MTTSDFINAVYSVAASVMQSTAVPASLLIAQALEKNIVNQLDVSDNDYFSTGNTYPDVLSSFSAQAQSLLEIPAFAEAVQGNSTVDALAWILGAPTDTHPEGQGYSPHTGYHNHIMNYITKSNLTTFDVVS
jgi:flagellum-specific peptidoglycan hydrolase FlgJ